MPAEYETILLPIALRLLGAASALLIGRWLAGLSRRWLDRSLRGAGLTPSIITLVVTLTYYGILLVAAMLALIILGVPASAVIGVAGIAVVVLAVALQQSLGNLAATINFLLFKPFVVGDLIETAGVQGIVSEIQMFSTVLDSPDNKTHILPNSKIMGAGVTNLSTKGAIRVDLAFRVSYQSDIERAKQVLQELLTGDSRVLEQPFPQVFVRKLDESHVELAGWPFIRIVDFRGFQADISERVKHGFEAAGIVIPYPQQEVHLSRSLEEV